MATPPVLRVRTTGSIGSHFTGEWFVSLRGWQCASARSASFNQGMQATPGSGHPVAGGGLGIPGAPEAGRSASDTIAYWHMDNPASLRAQRTDCPSEDDARPVKYTNRQISQLSRRKCKAYCAALILCSQPWQTITPHRGTQKYDTFLYTVTVLSPSMVLEDLWTTA